MSVLNYEDILEKQLGYKLSSEGNPEVISGKAFLPKENLTFGLLKYVLSNSKSWEVAYETLVHITPWCKLLPIHTFKRNYLKIKKGKKQVDNLLLFDLGGFILELEELIIPPPLKKIKENDMLDYKAVYYELLDKYENLQRKYDNLEEEKRNLDCNIKELSGEVSGKNKKVAGLKSSLKKAKMTTQQTDANIDRVGTDIIIKQPTVIDTS